MPPVATTPYPLRHLSFRVPWHDSGWTGVVCQAPKLNSACLRLARIGTSRKDEAEQAVAGKSIQELEPKDWPCCVGERGMFMAPFEYVEQKVHPYTETSPGTHGHFSPTPLRFPAYSAAGIPFRWMLRANLEALGQEHGLDIDLNREPELPFTTSWVQQRENHRALLDCFFGHVKPGQSLCFFYAKQVPFVEDARRVLIGVGRALNIGNLTEYRYKLQDPPLRSHLWECMIQHSIRPGFADGFLLPYHEALRHTAENPNFDPATLAAFSPGDRFSEFSYATEHVSHDGAIASLLACAASLHEAGKHLPGPWDKCLRWVDGCLGELWKMRGPCPGLGAVLCAFGIELGIFVAREIEAKLGQNEDPWPLVGQVFAEPRKHLSPEIARQIGPTLQATWKALPAERRALLQLLSRFALTPEQATLAYVVEQREAARLQCTDAELLKNPYRLFELTRLTADPIAVWTVDRGVFPDPVVRERHPLPEPSRLEAGTDTRRVRALTVEQLETASGEGHTLLPRKNAVLQIRGLEVKPGCEVTGDLMEVAQMDFAPEIQVVAMDDDAPAYQLSRLMAVGKVIHDTVKRRVSAKRHVLNADWPRLLEDLLGPVSATDRERETRARQEKAAALKEIAEARFSVLIGPAGTGKTTLLVVLCGQAEIAAGGVLLLAPTGKARVRMEQAARKKKLDLRGYTIAQFLGQWGRYDYDTSHYHLSERKAEPGVETVIVDEASMLTEEMLGALLDALRGVKRIILVGDPRQLPPIGAGRPFVDIIAEVAPKNVEVLFPRIGTSYAELTVRRRQVGEVREDLQLAEWFGGVPLPPGEDDIFDQVVKTGGSPHVRFVGWDTPESCHRQLLEVLAEALELAGTDDVNGFDCSLGAVVSGSSCYFNRTQGESGVRDAAERWQILSPVRGMPHGVAALNRLIHQRFRSRTVTFAHQKYRKIPKPLGPEEIVYGDKVINVRNHGGRRAWPEKEKDAYLANGEIGLAVGQFKTAKMTKAPWELQVEFSSQPSYAYKFDQRDFGEESQPILELAYALTVHKSQGSEFGLVFLVLPNPCRLLSRELLYTALTRQKDRVVILHQGHRRELKRYSTDQFSVTATRLTNLFHRPKLVEVEGRFFEDRLIHRTRRGDLVRSKSEVIVADTLFSLGLKDYAYEKELTIGEATRFPDFTIEDDATGSLFYWEHCGMLTDPDYLARWEKKLAWYRQNGILPHREGGGPRGTLIVTQDTEQGGISSQQIEAVARSVILGEARAVGS